MPTVKINAHPLRPGRRVKIHPAKHLPPTFPGTIKGKPLRTVEIPEDGLLELDLEPGRYAMAIDPGLWRSFDVAPAKGE